MNELRNARLTANAQTLRRNMTKEERHLWYDFLRLLPVRFNRQKVIGKYIVDFYCAEKQLVSEIDGAQHYEEAAHKKDEERDRTLQLLGLTVLRYSNTDINRNFAGVCADIVERIGVAFPEQPSP